MSVIASLAGGFLSSRAAGKAADAQTQANNNNIAFQREIYNDTKGRIEPFYQSGINNQAALDYEMFGGAAPTINGRQYGGFEMSPGNVFRLEQAQDAIEGSAAARGMLLSGTTLNSLSGNAIGMSNQFRDNYLNRLSAGASSGQSAAAMQANAGANAGAAIGQANSNIGNAQAAGAVAQGNAWSNALAQGVGAFNYHNQQNGTTGGLGNLLQSGSLGNSWSFG